MLTHRALGMPASWDHNAEFDVSPGCPLTRVVISQALAVGLEDSRKGGCGPHVEGKMFPLAKCWRLRDDGMDRTYWLAPPIFVSCLLKQRKGFLDRWQHTASDKSQQTHFLAWFFCETFSWLWASCLTILGCFPAPPPSSNEVVGPADLQGLCSLQFHSPIYFS